MNQGEVSETYTAIVDGRPVVIYNVPMLHGPDTDETFLAPDTTEKLYELLRHPEHKTGVVVVNVYEWQGSAQMPKTKAQVLPAGCV